MSKCCKWVSCAGPSNGSPALQDKLQHNNQLSHSRHSMHSSQSKLSKLRYQLVAWTSGGSLCTCLQPLPGRLVA